MNLLDNIIDNIVECEAKIGYQNAPLGLYYPKSSLLELLGTEADSFENSVREFCDNPGVLDKVTIIETAEPGRYEVTVSAAGVEYVHNNYKASEFLKNFLVEIRKPGNTMDAICELFNNTSPFWCCEKISDHESAIWFEEPEVDPYVYIVEENAFGLEYHRFTYEAYRSLVS